MCTAPHARTDRACSTSTRSRAVTAATGGKEAELDAVMNATGDAVGLLLDTGHLVFAGGATVGSGVIQAAYMKAGEVPPPYIGKAFALLGYIGLGAIVPKGDHVQTLPLLRNTELVGAKDFAYQCRVSQGLQPGPQPTDIFAVVN